jgi:hypothetical protein
VLRLVLVLVRLQGGKALLLLVLWLLVLWLLLVLVHLVGGVAL